MAPHNFLFYLGTSDIQGTEVRFSRAESHHISDVLRRNAGSEVEATDGCGQIYRIILERQEAGHWWGRIVDCTHSELDAPLPITLALPCLKGERWEIALEAACELGLQKVYLLDFQRASASWTKARQARARRKAIEALKQSGGSHLTAILALNSLRDFVISNCRSAKQNLWLADPRGGPLPEVISPGMLVVGPEAGLNFSEEELLQEYDVQKFSLGKRRLRSEIAAVVAMAQLAARLSR